MKAAREDWLDGRHDLDPECLIFIDESGVSTKMARLRGWAPKANVAAPQSRMVIGRPSLSSAA